MEAFLSQERFCLTNGPTFLYEAWKVRRHSKLSFGRDSFSLCNVNQVWYGSYHSVTRNHSSHSKNIFASTVGACVVATDVHKKAEKRCVDVKCSSHQTYKRWDNLVAATEGLLRIDSGAVLANVASVAGIFTY
eukprot:4278194-Amphidinium_carterae.1